MNLIEKLIALLKDDYKVAVEEATHMRVVYLSGDRVDKGNVDWAYDDIRKSMIKHLDKDPEKFDKDTYAIQFNQAMAALREKDPDAVAQYYSKRAEEVKKQLEDQFPGIIDKLRATDKELSDILDHALHNGPFAYFQHTKQHGICIVGEYRSDLPSPKELFTQFTGLKEEHFKPIPGSPQIWLKAFAYHEAAHCNQEALLSGVAAFNREIDADIHQIRLLRQNGEHDVAQAIMDLRILNAANDDPLHASSIFIDKPGFEEASAKHLTAASQFVDRMNEVVAHTSQIPSWKAASLRIQDPQRYASIIDQALKDGKFPLRDTTSAEQNQLIAAELGMSEEEFANISPDRLADVAAAYDKLKAQGAFKVTDTSETAVIMKEYAEAYVVAVRRLIIPDTTPNPDDKPKLQESKTATQSSEAPTPPEMPDSDKRLKSYAELMTTFHIEKAISEELKISREEAIILPYKDPELYYSTLERLLDENKIPTSYTITHLDSDQTAYILSQKLGISYKDAVKMKDEDSDRYNFLVSRMDGEYKIASNPYILAEIRANINEYRKSLGAEQTKENVPAESKQDQPVLKTGTYDYLAAEKPEMLAVKSAIKIDPETWAMTIAGQNPSALFNDLANYETAIIKQQAEFAQREALALATQQDFTRSATSQASRPS